ncbi:hypothetical protein SESBI_46710 [Sesbania bispinosa]|nr:hypothetical protein SESBI_46710 [Sesbania bispinosa]
MSDSKEISPEEVDLLARSTKKAKVEGIVETKDDVTIVMETMTKLMGRKRGSMNDKVEEDDSDSNDSNDESIKSMSGSKNCNKEEGHEEDTSTTGDPKCPIVKVIKEERKHACQPWTNSIIIKLLGKRIGLKFLQSDY